MNVSCPSCPAKYVVPDAKIRGRRLRMVCRHCGRPFVVDGTALPEERSDPSMDPVWVVMVNDRDATQMSARQLVELYAIGAIHSRTAVWRTGATEYRTPFDFPELAAALAARGLQPTAGVEGSSSPGGFDADEATVVGYVAQGGFVHGLLPRTDEGEEFDDEATVAVPRGTALAHFLDDGWGSEGDESSEDERTVTGDPRTFAAHAADYDDDDDPELGVARLPSELAARDRQSSILIAPNSGEEAGSRWGAQPRLPDGSAAARATTPGAPRWAGAVGASAVSTPRVPLPAAGTPAIPARAPLPAAGAPATHQQPSHPSWSRGNSQPPPPAEAPSRPSQRPPAAAARPAEGRPATSGSPLRSSSESRIPPPPAVIPPPPVGGAPTTARSSRSSLPPGAGSEPAPTSSSRMGAVPGVPPPPSSRPQPRPPAASTDDLDDDLFSPSRRRAKRRALLKRSALLVVIAALLALVSVYLYDRSLLVAAFPGLPEVVPALFPAPPPPLAATTTTTAVTPPPRPSASAGPPSSASAAPVATEPFDRREAVAALAIAAESARVCYDPAARVLGGMVIATFASSGQVTKVDPRGPLAGSPVGDCVARIFERVKIAPFLGDPVPVAQQVSLR